MMTTFVAVAMLGLTSALPTNKSRQLASWPIRTGYVAFGDSYAACLGTGTTTTDKCRVGSNNFGHLLYQWTNNPDVDYQQHACSGDEVTGLERQINEWSDAGKANVATLSIGGNDLQFSDLVKYCILTLDVSYDYRSDCVEKQVAAYAMLNNDNPNGLGANLTRAYKKILRKSGRAVCLNFGYTVRMSLIVMIGLSPLRYWLSAIL